MIEAVGIPIPQDSSVKSTILKRSLNITFYDTSLECANYCVARLDAEWDADVEDQWIFDKNNRSIFVKIANFEQRKYEKYVLMFEFIITLVDGSKSM